MCHEKKDLLTAAASESLDVGRTTSDGVLLESESLGVVLTLGHGGVSGAKGGLVKGSLAVDELDRVTRVGKSAETTEGDGQEGNNLLRENHCEDGIG